MNSMPLSSWHNRFNVEQINDIETEIQDVQKPNPCCNKSWMEALPSTTFLPNMSPMEALPPGTFLSDTLLMEALPSMTFSVNTLLMEAFPSATPSV